MFKTYNGLYLKCKPTRVNILENKTLRKIGLLMNPQPTKGSLYSFISSLLTRRNTSAEVTD